MVINIWIKRKGIYYENKIKDLPYSRFDIKRLEEAINKFVEAINKFVEAEKNASSVDDVMKTRKEWLDVVEDYFTSASSKCKIYSRHKR